MAFPVGYVPGPRERFDLSVPTRSHPLPVTHVRLRLVDGQEAFVDVLRAGLPGAEDEFGVRDRAGELTRAGAAELAEAIEAVTGVHSGRAERLAEQARAELG